MGLMHRCDECPHDLTVVRHWKNNEDGGGTFVSTPIVSLSDEDLLDEYAAEVDCDTRRISSDPPSPQDNLRAEILKRMSTRIY
jgi:hypothetical protein